MSFDEVLVTIRDTILRNVPITANITRIEFEGPKIIVYSANPSVFFENEDTYIKNIVRVIKKRVIVRADPRVRKSEEEAKRIILEIVPKEAEITNIFFDHSSGEVEIEARKPGYVIGKEGQTLRQIIVSTFWRPRVVRTPPVKSKTIEQVRELYRSRSDERIRFLRDVGQRIHRAVYFKNGGVRIVALGGFQEVGRSAILVQTPESNVLLDAGIKPSRPIDDYPYLDLNEFDIDSLDAVVITHAHLDHCGFLPFLFKYGYRGPIYTTEPTMHMMKLLQEDYIDVGIKEGKIVPYDRRHIAETLSHVITLNYGEVTDITPDIRLTLHPAGHILGSAMAHLHIGRGLYNILYTGDFKFRKTRLLNSAVYRFPRLEALIMESTYGASSDVMPSRRDTERIFSELVKKTLERGGSVLIPALAIGRAQEIMLVLNEGMDKGEIPEAPIYIEGMLREATAIHTAFPEHLSEEVKSKIYNNENPFMSERIAEVDDPRKREEIVFSGPCIVIATSGMLTGGPVMDYLRLMAPDEKNTLIFVNYQIEGTLGRRVLQGLRDLALVSPNGKIEHVRLNMEVHSVDGFSGHSDHRELLSYVHRVFPKPEKIILCHGEKSKIRELASAIRRRTGITTIEMGNADALKLK